MQQNTEKQQKISGTKSCLFENLNFIEMYFKQNDWKKKRHITSIKNERGIITTASVDAKRIISRNLIGQAHSVIPPFDELKSAD